MLFKKLSKKYIKTNIPENYIIKTKNKVSSTNLLMKKKALAGETEFSVLIANEQTKGRGRLGKSFHSPKGTGVYMSILLELKKGKNPLLITVDAAVCIAEALEKITGEKAFIKWVNDIYIKNRKVCGILAERVEDKVVLGIGINVFAPQNGFPDDIKDKAGYLFESKKNLMKEKVISEILSAVHEVYLNPNREELYNKYKDRSMLLDKDIIILKNDTEEPATAIDLDKDYSLVVKKENGEVKKLSTGDVSIRI